MCQEVSNNDRKWECITNQSIEWASGDNSQTIRWEHQAADGVRSHKFYRQNQEAFKEANDQASWGSWYWSTGDIVSFLSG
jgi:hypothetical protein